MSSTMSNFITEPVRLSSSSTPTSSASASATSSAAAQQQDQGNPQINFYRNLFYILIGLLGAFALAAVLSLWRARHRRRLIHAEATRLGLLAPGMPGYISIRDRRAARLMPGENGRSVGVTYRPEWWEVGAAGWMRTWVRPSAPARGYSGGIATSPGFGSTSFSFTPREKLEPHDQGGYLDLAAEKSDPQFRPLAIIPPQPTGPVVDAPLPKSTLKYFPGHLAYRPEDLLPPPLVWGGEGVPKEKMAEQLEGLRGAQVDLVTMIRMPESPEVVQARERGARTRREEGDDEDEDDAEEVVREWGGMCLGVVRMGVESVEGQEQGRASMVSGRSGKEV